MDDLSLGAVLGALIALILLSAFFSGSETGLMALNRYRLRHLARTHRGARLAHRLLKRPDRAIGLIVLGNNFVNILASALATWAALELFGEAGIALATLALTVIIVIFAEVAPKTAAALYPERIAFPAARVLSPLLRAAYPLVRAVNWLANGVLRLLRVHPPAAHRAEGAGGGGGVEERLGPDELRTVVNEAGLRMSERYRSMLVGLLDLEKVTVDHVMVPRNEIAGLDLEDDEKSLMETILASPHTQLPLYRGNVNAVEGVVHLRRMIGPISRGEFSLEVLAAAAREAYFTPLGTPLDAQLLAFQSRQERMALVVDEYGDVQGLVTVADILEEVVGEFATGRDSVGADVHPQADGTYLVDGGTSVRDLDRVLGSALAAEGGRLAPKTLNGLILEHLEAIPEPGTSLLLGGFPVEIVQATEHAVKTARIDPRRRPAPPTPDDDPDDLPPE